MKKMSKIIMCIMSTAVIVFLLALSAIAGYSFWTQTSQEDFEAGTLTNIDTTISGTFKLKITSWEETTTAHFNAGVIKDNINTANNELKLSSLGNIAPGKTVTKYSSGGWTDPNNINDGNLDEQAWTVYSYGSPYIGVNLANTYTIKRIRIKALRGWDYDGGYGRLQYYDGSWRDIPGTEKFYPHGSIQDNTYSVNVVGSYIRFRMRDNGNADQFLAVYELEVYVVTTGHFRSQEKDLGANCAFGKFYESHLSGSNYKFKARKYSGTSWSGWVTVTNGNKINLSNGTKVQYDITLTSADGVTNPKVYSVRIDYTKSDGNLISQYHDCGADIVAWGRLEANHTLNGQTITYAVRTSSYTAGLSNAAWYRVVSGNNITAPVNRYVQWKATLTTTDGTKSPVVDDVTVYWDPYPDAPTLTAPADNVWINDNTPLFQWSFNKLDPLDDNQEGFRVVIDDVNIFSGINYDSGIQISTATKWRFPEGTSYITLPDGIWYWKCCTKNNYGLWGDTSTYRILKIDTTPPDIPVMNAEPELTPGLENEVSWSSVTDAGCSGPIEPMGPIEYYVQCSSDSGFAWETGSSGWIRWKLTKGSWNFTGLRDGVTYYYRVKAQDALGNESDFSKVVWSRQDDPIITNYYASPDPFTPDGDGLKDATTIYYTLSRGCTVTVEIYDSNDSKPNFKKTLVDGKSRSEGEKSETWDGKDREGNTVRNGTYTYRITAEDEKHNIRQKEGKVRVENLVIIDSTIPGDNGYFVIGEDKDIEIKFNRHMSSTTMTPENIQIMDEYGGHLPLTQIAYGDSVTTITPLQKKTRYCTRYTVEISEEVTDILGNPLSGARSFSFTTLIPEKEVDEVIVKRKGGIVKVVNPSETFPGESKGWYINLVKAENPSLSKYIEGTARRLVCYKVDNSGNRKDIDELDRSVTISIPYPADIENKKNLKLYFYNKEINRWELVKGSGDTDPGDDDSVTGEVRVTNTEYCIRGFAVSALIENYSNYPNPFRAGKEKTTIEYDLEEDAKITISIYDLLGQLVKRIEIPEGTPEKGTQGTNRVFWNGKNERGRVVANGGYYCVIEADTETGKHMKKARKIMVIK